MGLPVGMMFDRSARPSDRVPSPKPRRYRLAMPGSHIPGCPLRHEADDSGVMRQVACADLRGTMGSCEKCQRVKR